MISLHDLQRVVAVINKATYGHYDSLVVFRARMAGEFSGCIFSVVHVPGTLRYELKVA